MARRGKKKIVFCGPCDFMHRKKVVATHGYKCEFSGEKTLCCETCYETYQSVKAACGELSAQFKGVTDGEG